MAKKCSNRGAWSFLLSAACAAARLALSPGDAEGCPFCNAVLPSFAQEREAAEIVALGEVLASDHSGQPANDDPPPAVVSIRVRQLVKGNRLARVDQVIETPRTERLRAGALCLLLASARQESDEESSPARQPKFQWTYRPVTETSYAYFVQSPDLRVAAPQRLRYFARFLQHPDTAIANDAYLEFGHAPFDVVAQVADALPIDKMAQWLLDDGVPQERKGFYGLALGLVRSPDERAARCEMFRPLVLNPEDDFRAGFGGVLGGFLLVAGQPGLDVLDKHYLNNPASAEGDVRSVQSALRFYHEYGREIPPARQAASLRLLLRRPAFAAETIADLARWEDWETLPAVVALYDGPADYQPALRRSVVGYLMACSRPESTGELARLRSRDPSGVAEAERQLHTLGGVR